MINNQLDHLNGKTINIVTKGIIITALIVFVLCTIFSCKKADEESYVDDNLKYSQGDIVRVDTITYVIEYSKGDSHELRKFNCDKCETIVLKEKYLTPYKDE